MHAIQNSAQDQQEVIDAQEQQDNGSNEQVCDDEDKYSVQACYSSDYGEIDEQIVDMKAAIKKLPVSRAAPYAKMIRESEEFGNDIRYQHHICNEMCE